MISGQLGNWLERNGIYAGRIHYMVYGLDRVMSFFWKMACIIWCGTTYNNVLNLVDDILLHDAWCMGDGNNYSGPPCIDATLVFDFSSA